MNSRVALARENQVDKQQGLGFTLLKRTLSEKTREEPPHLAVGRVLPSLDMICVAMNQTPRKLAIVTGNEHTIKVMVANNG